MEADESVYSVLQEMHAAMHAATHAGKHAAMHAMVVGRQGKPFTV